MNINQCIFPRLNIDQYSADLSYRQLIKSLVSADVGGFCIFGGTIDSVSRTLAELQFMAITPLLFCADFEHGLPMRLTDGGTAFPHHMALAKATEKANQAQYVRGAAGAIAKEARSIGVLWNLAPVCDINSNPQNPVINIRAFGQDPKTVATNAAEYIAGTQAELVATCAKHFPGHGDLNMDSHIQIPTINKTWQALKAYETTPFVAACKAGVQAIMVGHISVGAKEVADIWKNNIQEARKMGEEVGWNGIITTDALDMAAIVKAEQAGAFSKFSTNIIVPGGEATACAFAAGADIILMPHDPLAAINALNAMNTPEYATHIEEASRRVRKLKQFVKLLPQSPGATTAQPQLFAEHMQLALKIAVDAIEIIPAGGARFVPLPEDMPLAAFSVLQRPEDLQAASRFFTMLGQATENDCDYAFLDENITQKQLQDMATAIEHATFVVFALFYKGRGYSGSLAEVSAVNNIIKTLANGRPAVVVCLGDPYIASQIEGDTKILTYSDSFASLAAAVAVLADRQPGKAQ